MKLVALSPDKHDGDYAAKVKALRGTEIMFEGSRKREQAGAFPRILNNKSGGPLPNSTRSPLQPLRPAPQGGRVARNNYFVIML